MIGSSLRFTLTEYWQNFHLNLVNLYEHYKGQNNRADQEYLSIHKIAIQIAKMGQQIEDAPLFKKYKLGKKIDQLFEQLPLDNLPTVNSFYTLQIAKIFMEHSNYYANGQVYSNQFLVNSHLYLHQNRAHTDVATLQKRIETYENTIEKTNKKYNINDIRAEQFSNKNKSLQYFELVHSMDSPLNDGINSMTTQQMPKAEISIIKSGLS